MRTVEVVAAIIYVDKKILATQRRDGIFKDYWEFPGGKIEAGETKEEALKREIKEELNVDISVESFFTTIEYDYSNFHLILHCFLCTLHDYNFRLNVHKDLKLVTKDELSDLQWLPADYQILSLIQQLF